MRFDRQDIKFGDNDCIHLVYKTGVVYEITTELGDKFHDQKLIDAFQELKTINEKLDFWLDQLKLDYCFYNYTNIDITGVFEIETENLDEIRSLNQRNLNQFVQIINAATHEFRGADASPILRLDRLISRFKNIHESSIDYESDLEREVERINELMNDFKNKSFNFPIEMRDTDAGATYQSFNYYRKNNEMFMGFKGLWDSKYLGFWYNGMIYAQYLSFLEEELKQSQNKYEKPPAKTLLAILELLGVIRIADQNEISNIELSKLISLIAGGSPESYRKILSDPRIVKEELQSIDNNKQRFWAEFTELINNLPDSEFKKSINNQLNR